MEIKELGHVVLYVTDSTKMADFYRDTLGFHEGGDPDGNELELYSDVSDTWRTDPSAVLKPARGLSLQ